MFAFFCVTQICSIKKHYWKQPIENIFLLLSIITGIIDFIHFPTRNVFSAFFVLMEIEKAKYVSTPHFSSVTRLTLCQIIIRRTWMVGSPHIRVVGWLQDMLTNEGKFIKLCNVAYWQRQTRNTLENYQTQHSVHIAFSIRVL